MKRLISPLFLFLVCCSTSRLTKEISIAFNDKNISYEGRIGENTKLNAAEIYWPGSSVSIKFEGQKVSAILEDENGDNYYNVILDGEPKDVLRLKKGKKIYLLADNLSSGVHTVELHKRNDWTFGTSLFYGFKIALDSVLQLPKKNTWIEFYGDSVTVGYGNEDDAGQDRSTGDVTNNYLAYGAITARNLNAEYTCIAHSGIGIMVSWHDLIMSEEYDRFNPNDESSKWNFYSRQPDIVVINLFQNDSWLVNRESNIQFKHRFGSKTPSKEQIIESYVSFVKTIRSKYSKAKIICMLGSMDITQEGSVWPDYVLQAVNRLNDNGIYTLFAKFKNTKGHPKVNEQAAMAEQLTVFVKSLGF